MVVGGECWAIDEWQKPSWETRANVYDMGAAGLITVDNGRDSKGPS